MGVDREGRGAAVASVRRAAPGDPAGAPDRADVPPPPPELRRLLEPSDPAARDAAWDAFVARHSRLLLHLARLVMPDRDGAMDAYAHLLEQLRRDDFRALRIYTADGRSQFTTWLAVVARRTCVDFYRHRYGRPRGDGTTRRVEMERAVRQRLTDLAGSAIELAELADARSAGPEGELRAAQLHEALHAAIAGLPAADRLLLKLRFEDGLSGQAIASVVGLPSTFHAHRRIKAVLRELQRRLAARGIESSAP
jgi:RNA polymerase sigma factor (sigma-70 family)